MYNISLYFQLVLEDVLMYCLWGSAAVHGILSLWVGGCLYIAVTVSHTDYHTRTAVLLSFHTFISLSRYF